MSKAHTFPIFAFVLLALIISSTFASSEPAESISPYESLKTRYLSLRNTDVEITRAAEWQSLAKEFSDFVDADPTNRHAAHALFNGAILWEELYKKFGKRPDLDRALKFFDRVPLEYPADLLADDALLRQGELFLYELGDAAAARKSLNRIVNSYPHGDMLASARRDLDAIESGSYRTEMEENPRQKPPEPNGKAMRRLIVIDPGHGGEDFGAVGPDGLLEKTVALDVAKRLEVLLERNPGTVVRLTRNTDQFVPLAERTSIANDFDAGIFVSLHTNASPNKSQQGIETYYLDNSGDQASHKLAERENSSLQFEGTQQGDLQFILSDLIQNAKLDDSILLANLVQRSLVAEMRRNWNPIRDLGVKKAPFYVLVGAHMPCILVELSFIDHPQEGSNLSLDTYREDLAKALSKSITKYFSSLDKNSAVKK